MTNDIYKILGENIKIFRNKNNMNLEELAKKANISVSFLNNIEKGSRKPTLYTLEKISNALNCPLTSLLTPKTTNSVYSKEENKIILEILKIISKKNLSEKKKILDIIKLL